MDYKVAIKIAPQESHRNTCISKVKVIPTAIEHYNTQYFDWRLSSRMISLSSKFTDRLCNQKQALAHHFE